MIAALYKGEIPRLDFEFRFRGRDGTWRGRASTASWCAGRTAARRMVGVTGDITETRQRERQLDTAKAEAAAAHRDVEQTRETMQTVLDNMTDGVTLFDKDFRWRFSNRAAHRGARVSAGVSLSGIARPRHGALPDRARRFWRGRRSRGPGREPRSASSRPAATATIARTSNGRYVEFNFTPLNDGGLLGLYRDITELKEREDALAAAKEAAEAARDAAERSRAEATAARNEVERTRRSCRPCSTT